MDSIDHYYGLGLKTLVTVFISCLFISFDAKGESGIPDLEALLEREVVDEGDIDTMLDIINELIQSGEENIEPYLDSVLNLTKEQRYFDGIQRYLTELHRYLTAQREYESAKEQIEEIFKKFESDFNAEQKIDIELLLANLTYNTGDSEQAYLLFEDLYNRSSAEEDRAYIYINRGAIYRERGQYDSSIENYLEALSYYNSTDNVELQIELNNRLGVTYYDIRDYETSIRFYLVAQELAKSVDDVGKLLEINSNLATSYRRAGEYELALVYMEDNLSLAREQGDRFTVAQNLLNIANVYSNNLGNHEKAHDYNQQSLEIASEMGLDYGIVLNHMSIGRAYHRQGNYEQALVSYDSARTYSSIMELGHVMRTLNEHTSEAHTALGNFEEALSYHLEYHELITEQFSEDREQAIADMQTRYETELKTQELEHSRELATKQRTQIFFLNLSLVLVGLGAVGLILFLIHRNRNMKALYQRNKELLHNFNKLTYQVIDTEKSERNEKTKTSDPQFQLFKRITELFESEELYTEPELSLKKVADKLSSNEKYVSMAISTYADMNFSNFVNLYRINKARSILSNADNSYRINEVMYECGYNSSSTFYSAFKNFTGMTPKQFTSIANSEQTSQSAAE